MKNSFQKKAQVAIEYLLLLGIVTGGVLVGFPGLMESVQCNSCKYFFSYSNLIMNNDRPQPTAAELENLCGVCGDWDPVELEEEDPPNEPPEERSGTDIYYHYYKTSGSKSFWD